MVTKIFHLVVVSTVEIWSKKKEKLTHTTKGCRRKTFRPHSKICSALIMLFIIKEKKKQRLPILHCYRIVCLYWSLLGKYTKLLFTGNTIKTLTGFFRGTAVLISIGYSGIRTLLNHTADNKIKKNIKNRSDCTTLYAYAISRILYGYTSFEITLDILRVTNAFGIEI